ncbi:Short transient receptor potential channel 3 [Lamellibrachia satsuma]|nr:Short transient receptor potential channel 3 [Lamellibrachia satsuma]
MERRLFVPFKARQNGRGHDRRGEDRRGQDKAKQGKARRVKTTRVETRPCEAMRGKARRGETRQDKTRQDKTRQDKTRDDKGRQHKTRQQVFAMPTTLTDEERVYLNAAAVGDVPVLRQSLEESDVSLNVNCVDYMGRSALHLAIDNENTESIELLLDKLSFECIDESLLHAISKGSIKTVKMIIEHPSYMAGEDKVRRKGVSDPFFRTEEKSQFSPDITPLILSAHYNNHEIIQMFLSRNQTIERPHPISCQCRDCVIKQNYDSLKRSRSRLNAYRALASPAFMALSSRDPIMATFELRQEMKKLAQVEKEFQNEYLALVEQCMDFACELMDLCRGTQEVEAVLGEGSDETGTRDPLARLKMAMEYEEKKFVAHPNCQQHLTSIWYGPEMGFMQSMGTARKIFMWVGCIPLVPFICLLGNALRCPATKFISHTLSHICFLVLLTAATFRVDQQTTYPIASSDFYDSKYEHLSYEEKADNVLRTHFRPANVLMCKVQLCLMFWVVGLLWMECKQMYNSGLRVYLLDNYNSIDYAVLSLYLASYTLRFLVDYRVAVADTYYNGTARARQALLVHGNISLFNAIRDEIFDDITQPMNSYFMRASRFYWRPNDPEIVADVLFAMANVLSIARTTYLMPAFEVLGPLQIALGRMIGDITRFLVLFTLVVFAFMVGLHNIYWYYGSQTYQKQMEDGTTKLTHSTEAFQGMAHTLFSLFWSMFGLVNINSVLVTYPDKQAIMEKSASDGTSLVEGVGMFLFAFYHVVIIIVLVNMLIAMMSHSFEDIQGDCDVEWKFARTRLWMNYIDDGSTLPVPFNILPTVKSFNYAWRFIRGIFPSNGKGHQEFEMGKKDTFISVMYRTVFDLLYSSVD